MRKKMLLSAPIGCPGSISALRNHKAVLRGHVDCDFVPLELLIFPHLKKNTQVRRVYYGVSRRLRIASIKNILPYGENIIFGSFSPTHEIIVRKLNKHGIRPSFIWHSSLGQLEQTPGERQLLIRITEFLDKGKIKYLLLHRRLYDSIGTFVKGATFLPHSIDLSQFQRVTKKHMSGVNCDLFCRLRFGKNILNQALAFRIATLDGVLHINFDPRLFQGILEMMNANVVRHTWLPLDDYYNLIAGMDFSLQVTIGESFNYAVCERMALGIPVLTTRDIYLVSEDAFLKKYLCVSTPDTPQEIAKSVEQIINDPQLREDIAQRCKRRVVEVANANNKIVIDQVGSLFS